MEALVKQNPEKAYAVLVMDKHRPWRIASIGWDKPLAIYAKRSDARAYAKANRQDNVDGNLLYGIRYKTISVLIQKF